MTYVLWGYFEPGKPVGLQAQTGVRDQRISINDDRAAIFHYDIADVIPLYGRRPKYRRQL